MNLLTNLPTTAEVEDRPETSTLRHLSTRPGDGPLPRRLRPRTRTFAALSAAKLDPLAARTASTGTTTLL